MKLGGYPSELYRSKTYTAWANMKMRCEPSAEERLRTRYYDRGIKVCDPWLLFRNFFLDMGVCPDNMQLDRIDNNRGYEPGNCQWVTSKRNCNNKENNRRLTFAGETRTLQEWADRLNVPRGRIRSRLRAGWSVDRALTLGRVK